MKLWNHKTTNPLTKKTFQAMCSVNVCACVSVCVRACVRILTHIYCVGGTTTIEAFTVHVHIVIVFIRVHMQNLFSHVGLNDKTTSYTNLS